MSNATASDPPRISGIFLGNAASDAPLSFHDVEDRAQLQSAGAAHRGRLRQGLPVGSEREIDHELHQRALTVRTDVNDAPREHFEYRPGALEIGGATAHQRHQPALPRWPDGTRYRGFEEPRPGGLAPLRQSPGSGGPHRAHVDEEPAVHRRRQQALGTGEHLVHGVVVAEHGQHDRRVGAHRSRRGGDGRTGVGQGCGLRPGSVPHRQREARLQ